MSPRRSMGVSGYPWIAEYLNILLLQRILGFLELKQVVPFPEFTYDDYFSMEQIKHPTAHLYHQVVGWT